MSDTDEGLRQYLDPKSKYAGYEMEVTVEVRHNEAEEDWNSDWRCDWRRTYYGAEAQAVMRAIRDRADLPKPSTS